MKNIFIFYLFAWIALKITPEIASAGIGTQSPVQVASRASPIFAPISSDMGTAVSSLFLIEIQGDNATYTSRLLPEFNDRNLQTSQHPQLIEAVARALIAAQLSPDEIAKLSNSKSPTTLSPALQRGQDIMTESLAKLDSRNLAQAIETMGRILPIYRNLPDNQARFAKLQEAYFHVLERHAGVLSERLRQNLQQLAVRTMLERPPQPNGQARLHFPIRGPNGEEMSVHRFFHQEVETPDPADTVRLSDR